VRHAILDFTLSLSAAQFSLARTEAAAALKLMQQQPERVRMEKLYMLVVWAPRWEKARGHGAWQVLICFIIDMTDSSAREAFIKKRRAAVALSAALIL